MSEDIWCNGVQVKANREAPTLDLTKAEDVTKPTTAGWNATFTPQTDMEKEVAKALATWLTKQAAPEPFQGKQ